MISYRTTYAIEVTVTGRPGHGISAEALDNVRRELTEEAQRLGVPVDPDDMMIRPARRGETVVSVPVLVETSETVPPSVMAMRVEHDAEEREQRG